MGLVYVLLDDWECLYLDGKMVAQGHRLQIGNLWRVLCEHGVDPSCTDYLERSATVEESVYAEDTGSLPDDLYQLNAKGST